MFDKGRRPRTPLSEAVDRAEILGLEGDTEPAEERRATAFGLLAQPAVIVAMLLRHAEDGQHTSFGRDAPQTPHTPATACQPGQTLSDPEDA